MNSNYYKLATL